MNGWSPTEQSLNTGTPQAIAASQTNTVVSKEWKVTAGGSTNQVVAIDCSAVTVAAAITAKLQTAIGSVWVDSKTVTITADGRFYIKLNTEVAGDQTYLPLLAKCRLVVTTGAGDAVTVDNVYVLQQL